MASKLTGFYITKMTLKSLVTLITLATLSECRSIPSTGEETSDLSWLPQDLSLEEWDRCYGMPCDKQNKLRQKLHELQMLNFNANEENLDSNYAYDITHNDASLDGCILLNEQQLDVMINQTKEELEKKNSTEEEKEEHSRQRRSLTNFHQFPDKKWQKHEFPIGYTFDGKHNEVQRNVIRGAISHWQEQTCIRFRELKGQPYPENYIVFSDSNWVCHSYVGKQSGAQPIFLSENCLWNFGTPVHEIAHALGVWHTQMRPDRDQNVKIHKENLAYYIGQYSTVDSVMNHGVPYDFSSVMHYSPLDGSINNKLVIEARDARFQKTMGQRVGLSFYDAMLINREYCSDVCHGNPWRPCQRGGYQDPNNCEKCICPDGFGGPYCEDVAPPSPGAKCGGKIEMPKYMTRVISSPQYDPGQNSFYYDHTECSWLVVVPAGWNVVLRFQEKFGLLVSSQGECYHWVEVKYKTDKQHFGPRYCDSQTPDDVLVSEDQEMLIIFKSNFSSSNPKANVGFQALVSMVPAMLVVDRNSNKQPRQAPVNTATPAPITPPSSSSTTTTTQRPSTKSTTTPPKEQTRDNFLWFCNFETSDNHMTWCNITQEKEHDQFDWDIISGNTDSDMTGPDNAFNGNYYIYIEASKPRIEGDEAMAILPRFGRSGEHCLSWRYYMFGHHINTLKIVVEGDGRYDVVWSRNGEQTPVQWLLARVTVRLTAWARILFIGSRGREYSGDIAVDAISLLSGPCWTS